MEWALTLRLLVEKVATPLLSSTLVPRVVVPSLKITLPPGVLASPGQVCTVAVNVTVWPKAAGLTSAVRAVDVNLVSALYVASSADQRSFVVIVAFAEKVPVAATMQYMPKMDGTALPTPLRLV